MRRPLRSALLGLILLATWLSQGARAAETVDVLLVLAVDVSLSIDDPKFQLERRGYADAFSDPRVLRAIAEGRTGRIAVALVEWAGPEDQTVVVDWTIIAGAADARAFAAKLQAAPRSFSGRTAVGSAIDFAAGLIAGAPFQADRQVIDVSGDGTSNGGRAISEARDAAVAQGITINGIVILTDPTGLSPYLVAHTNPPGGLAAYYRETVIGGEGAFVMSAESFESFGRALIAKLVREIS
ncbi:DUF1194 domain-containing protein [uncultured Methylobacterium sp.]|uniref:DUF1194 domain-containing protein n=1 Tax=uncultured Methylobacterium sp. TaxID=157278 RepID=UPI0035C95711